MNCRTPWADREYNPVPHDRPADGKLRRCALIDVAFIVKATGRKVVEEDEVHIWEFDARGKVARFRHKLDTHQHWVACEGE